MAEKTVVKQRGRPFKKGQSGNPGGRPPGARNQATMAALTLLEGEASALTRKAIDAALGGDIQALRLCMERIVAPTKDRPIRLKLPLVETALDIPKLTGALLLAVGSGEIAPSEAATMARLVESHRSALELADIEERLRKLEVGVQK